MENHEYHIPLISVISQIKTIQQFIKYGGDIEEAANTGSFASLFRYETECQGACVSKFGSRKLLASTWIYNDILPALYSNSIDKEWWQACLVSVASHRGFGHSAFDMILRQYDIHGIRFAFLGWLTENAEGMLHASIKKYRLGGETDPDILQQRFDLLSNLTFCF